MSVAQTDPQNVAASLLHGGKKKNSFLQQLVPGRRSLGENKLILPKCINLISDFTFLSGRGNEYKGLCVWGGGVPFTSQEIAGIEEKIFFTSLSTSQYWPQVKKFNSPQSSLVETVSGGRSTSGGNFHRGNVTKYFKITNTCIFCLNSSPSRNIIQSSLEVCSGESRRAIIAALLLIGEDWDFYQ